MREELGEVRRAASETEGTDTTILDDQRQATTRAAPKTLEDLILETIEGSGGISISQLKDEVDASWGTLYDRLETLEERELLVIVTSGGSKTLFGTKEATDPETLATARDQLTSQTANEIGRFVVDGGASDIQEIADAVQESRRLCYYHVRRLVDAELIYVRRRSRLVNMKATALLEQLI